VLYEGCSSHGLDSQYYWIDAPWMMSPGEHTEIWDPTLGDAQVAETPRLLEHYRQSKPGCWKPAAVYASSSLDWAHGGFKIKSSCSAAKIFRAG